MYNKNKKRSHKGRDPHGPTAPFCTKRLFYFPLIFLLATALIMVLPSEIQVVSVEGATTKKELFRPFYDDKYGKGTMTLGNDVNCTITNATGLTREWNFIGWNVSKLTMQIRLAVSHIEWALCSGTSLPFWMTLWFSLDKGETYTVKRDLHIPVLDYRLNNTWGSPWWYYADFYYEFPEEDFSLFTLDTRIKFSFHKDWFEPPYWTHPCVVYWSYNQTPIPPYDYIDEEGGFVQYYMLFHVEYEEDQIDYTGPTESFEFLKTKSKLKSAGSMILNCIHPSGCVNEVVTTDIPFGKHTWVVLYSSQLAMMELLDLASIMASPVSNATINSYLLATKRFIEYMFSKQNLTDGSFPFILTDGDQHCWHNETTNSWWGYDKIDSFSACAISLVAKYYNVTEDMDLVNQYWYNILKCRDFIDDLTNKTIWLPVDGYHYNGTTKTYYKSEWNWLHDVCEAYQGLKDLAYLYGAKGDSGNQTYFDNYAETIAQSMRDRMWNETLHRYVGLYNVNIQTQNPVLVYNVVTPTVYGIETNTTRASETVQTYLSWGIMSGRYLNQSWAEDYNVNNEYSTMGSMCFSSFYELTVNHDYHNQWMNDKFNSITHFLFKNPLYPYNYGNLQNQYGFLDWVNLVDKNWAKDYARLIETSAWFIDGFIKLPYLEDLWQGPPDTPWEDEPWWEKDEPVVETVSWVLANIPMWLGIGGFCLLIACPILLVYSIKKKEYELFALILLFGFAFGFACIVVWLWS